MSLRELEEARSVARLINENSSVIPHLTAIYRVRNHLTRPLPGPITDRYLIKLVDRDAKDSRFIFTKGYSLFSGGYLLNIPGDLRGTLVPYYASGEWGDGNVMLSPMSHVPSLDWGTLTMIHLEITRQVNVRPVALFGEYREYCATIGGKLFRSHDGLSGAKCEYSETLAGAEYYADVEPCPRCGFMETENCPLTRQSDHTVDKDCALSRLRSIGAIWW